MYNWASDEFNTDNGCGPHAALSLSQRWVILIRFHYFASLDNRVSIDLYHQQWASGKRKGQENKSAESEQKALCNYPELCVEFLWSSQATSKWIRILEMKCNKSSVRNDRGTRHKVLMLFFWHNHFIRSIFCHWVCSGCT